MGSASRSIGVTFHPPSRQYKKTIGRRRGPDGKPRPQVFYLGTDQREAKNRAFLLMAVTSGRSARPARLRRYSGAPMRKGGHRSRRRSP